MANSEITSVKFPPREAGRSSAASSLLTLPDEVLLRVLSSLSNVSPTSLAEFRQASQKCRVLSGSMVSEVKLGWKDLEDSRCLNLADIFPHIQTLTLPVSAGLQPFIMQALPSLQHVERVRLPLECARLSSVDLKLLVSSCPRLRSLSVSVQDLDEAVSVIAALSSLVELTIVPANGNHLKEQHVQGIATMTQLTSLSLSGMSRPSALMSNDSRAESCLASVTALSSLQLLRSLSLGNVQYTDATIDAIVSLTNLTHLDLLPDNPSFISDDVTDESLAQLSKITQLQRLSIDVDERSGHVFLPGWCTLPCLRHLCLRGCILSGLPKGTRFQGLRSLILEDMYEFEDIPVLSHLGLDTNLPTLEVISLKDCEVHSSEVFRQLACQVNLRELHIDCVDVSILDATSLVKLTPLTNLEMCSLGVKDLDQAAVQNAKASWRAALPLCQLLVQEQRPKALWDASCDDLY